MIHPPIELYINGDKVPATRIEVMTTHHTKVTLVHAVVPIEPDVVPVFDLHDVIREWSKHGSIHGNQ